MEERMLKEDLIMIVNDHASAERPTEKRNGKRVLLVVALVISGAFIARFADTVISHPAEALIVMGCLLAGLIIGSATFWAMRR